MAEVWSVGSEEDAQPRRPGIYVPLDVLLQYKYDSDHDESVLSPYESAVPFAPGPSTSQQLQQWLDEPSLTARSPRIRSE